MKKNLVTTPLSSTDLIKCLARERLRLFSSQDVRTLLESQGLAIAHLKNKLNYLKAKGWIHLIRKNLYALDDIFLEREPIHEYEIATRLVTPSALSHFTAFQIHELTDQLPVKVFVTVPTHSTLPGSQYSYLGTTYKYVQVKQDQFFGFEYLWRGNTKIPITDLERTLLDGLIKPKYCGGMREVIHAYTTREFNAQKLVEYALRLGKSVPKRLGWVLEKTGYTGPLLEKLESVSRKGFVLLDPSGKNYGPSHKRWQIRENI